MKIILVLATLMSLMFANESQKELLAKEHNNMQKMQTQKSAKYVNNKLTEEEMKMQREIAVSAGAPMSMDIVTTKTEGN